MSVAEMSDSGIGWIGKIPTHWQIRKFRYCGTIPNGQVDPRLPEFRDQILVAPNHIKSGTGRLLGTATAEEQGAESGKYLFRAGDVLYSKIRPELAKVCLIDFPGLCSADMYPISPNRDLYPGFLAYQMICIGFTESVVLASARVAMPKVNRDELGGISLVIPPRPEQKTISTFLDRKTAQIDTLIAKKQRLIELLQEKRQALISRAVTKGLDPNVPMKDSGVEWIGTTPRHWESPRTRFVAKLESGHTPSRNHPEYWVNCTVPWITLADVWQLRDGTQKYIRETKEHVSDVGLANSSARLLPANTVIVSRTASVGFSGIMALPMATTQDFVNWVCGKRILADFLLWVFRGMKQEFRRLMMGSTHKTIYMPDAERFSTPLPPIEEQQRIADYLDSETQRFDKIAEKISAQITKLQEYRQTLISAAVTGKIDVRKEAHP